MLKRHKCDKTLRLRAIYRLRNTWSPFIHVKISCALFSTKFSIDLTSSHHCWSLVTIVLIYKQTTHHLCKNVSIFTAHVAKRTKVMFSQASVCPTRGRWHQMHHGIGHMVGGGGPVKGERVGHNPPPPKPQMDTTPCLQKDRSLIPPPDTPEDRKGHWPLHPPIGHYGRAVCILLECILVV